MNREIKFRGKRIDTGEWAFGNLLRTAHNAYIKEIVDETRYAGECYSVARESVGQYVGFKGYEGDKAHDKKREVELYEGDIVEAWSQGSCARFQIKFREGYHPGWLLYPNGQHRQMWSIAASDTGRQKGDYYDDLRRLGNIYEHPDLLPLPTPPHETEAK